MIPPKYRFTEKQTHQTDHTLNVIYAWLLPKFEVVSNSLFYSFDFILHSVGLCADYIYT